MVQTTLPDCPVLPAIYESAILGASHKFYQQWLCFRCPVGMMNSIKLSTGGTMIETFPFNNNPSYEIWQLIRS